METNIIPFKKNEDFIQMFTALELSNQALQSSNNVIRALAERQERLEKENKKLKYEIEKNERELTKRIDKVQQENLEQVKTAMYVKENDGYLTQRGLGDKFAVPIGSVYLGKFLQKIGLARAIDDHDGSGKRTVPYRSTLDRDIAKNSITETGYQHYLWNVKKTMEYIENWLSKKGLYNEFLKIKNTEEMKGFINSL